MGRLLKGTPLSYVNPKQVVWVRTTAGDFPCVAETEINSSEVTVVVQDNGFAHAFCESAPRESYRRIVRNQRGYPRAIEEEIQNFAIAILYLMRNGVNAEVWLQDAEAEPQLVATLPPRISLSGFTATIEVPNLGSDSELIGYIKRPTSGFGLDIERSTVNGGFADRGSIEVLTATPVAFFNEATLTVGLQGGGAATLFSVVANGNIINNGFVTTTLESSTSTGAISLNGNYSATGGGQPPTVITTTSILSIANFLDARLQRRASGAFVYLKNRPYANPSVPPATGQSYSRVSYWVNGEASEFDAPTVPEADPSDVTGEVLNYLSDFGILSSRSLNQYTPTLSYRYIGNFGDLINDGESVEALASDGSKTFPVTAKGVTASAIEILSVAVYAR